MKRFLAILPIMTFSLIGIVNVYGEPMSDRTLAIEYLQVSQFEQAIDTAIDTYSFGLYGDKTDAERAEMKRFMQSSMGWEAIKDQLADLVVKLYTREELEAAIAFEKSRLGASITAKNEQFAKQFAELLSRNMQRFSQRTNLPQPDPAVNPESH